jgi:hypothetical protein
MAMKIIFAAPTRETERFSARILIDVSPGGLGSS